MIASYNSSTSTFLSLSFTLLQTLDCPPCQECVENEKTSLPNIPYFQKATYIELDYVNEVEEEQKKKMSRLKRGEEDGKEGEQVTDDDDDDDEDLQQFR